MLILHQPNISHSELLRLLFHHQRQNWYFVLVLVWIGRHFSSSAMANVIHMVNFW